MTFANSRPVGYRPKAIDRDHGPYRRGALWADPDLDEAAQQLRRLAADRGLARALGERARDDMARRLSPARVGELIYSCLFSLSAHRARRRLEGADRSIEHTIFAGEETLMEPAALSHRRVLGPWVTLFKRAVRKSVRWYIRPQLAGLQEQIDRLTERSAASRSDLARMHQHLADLENQRAEQQGGFLNQALEIFKELEQLRQRADAADRQLAEQAGDLRRQLDPGQPGPIHDLVHRCEALHGALRAEHQRVSVFLREATRAVPQPLPERLLPLHTADQRHDLDGLYSSFEDHFRGSREEIKRRQAVYLPLLTEHGLGTQGMPILDLGCGRGEWLELLRDTGLCARGVDLNRLFLEQCRQFGLAVEEADLLEYLRALPEASVGVVSGFHIIEHLPFAQQLQLLDDTLRVLRPGGLALFETPNPENLVVGACNFYADPTHHHPLYPPTLQFLARARGFVRTEIHRVNRDTITGQFCEAEAPAQWQRLFEYLKHHFLAAPDYAVIGWKA
jgi:O-antigen chain-terminating methyltransferase